VVDFLTSQHLRLSTDQRQQEQHGQWHEQALTQATSDLNHRLHSNIAMQLKQAALQYPSLLHPDHLAAPFESSLSPNISPHMPLYSADFKMAVGAAAREQIAFEYDYVINPVFSVATMGQYRRAMLRETFVT